MMFCSIKVPIFYILKYSLIVTFICKVLISIILHIHRFMYVFISHARGGSSIGSVEAGAR